MRKVAFAQTALSKDNAGSTGRLNGRTPGSEPGSGSSSLPPSAVIKEVEVFEFYDDDKEVLDQALARLEQASAAGDYIEPTNEEREALVEVVDLDLEYDCV